MQRHSDSPTNAQAPKRLSTELDALEDDLRQSTLNAMEELEAKQRLAARTMRKIQAGGVAVVVLAAAGFASYSGRTSSSIQVTSSQNAATPKSAPVSAPAPPTPAAAPEVRPVESLKQPVAPGTVASSVRPAGQTAPAVAPVVKVPTAPAAKESPAPAASSVVPGKQHLTITAMNAHGSWVDACADGRTVARKFVPERGTVDVEFSSNAVVRLGNPDGTTISFNGQPAGPAGQVGRPKIVLFDANGFHPAAAGEPGSDCGRH